MAIKLTPEQERAIEEQGKVIVSASAGSGKTFVMIERLTRYILEGDGEGGRGDLDDVLAVTFTKKAAAQMKEKLRGKIIDKINQPSTSADDRRYLKQQLAKIPTANISTIHSFCVYLLRTHFYLLDIDGSFDILSEDNGEERKLRKRAVDAVFDNYYNSEVKDPDFLLVLCCYTNKRSDGKLRAKIVKAYDDIRIYGDYKERLKREGDFYTEDNFNKLCAPYIKQRADACRAVHKEFDDFMATFSVSKPKDMEKFCRIYADTVRFLTLAENSTDICEQLPKFDVETRPRVKGEDEPQGEAFGDIRSRAKDAYEMYKGKFQDRATELDKYYKCGALAAAFANMVLAFDEAYTAVKREEGKLDYSDLEHLTLELLGRDEVKKEVSSGFKRVFVDEYQDVNPVQEAIISAVSGGNVFLVGDVKQAIYSFRGSESKHFTKKFDLFKNDSGAHALTLPDNFRSAPAVIKGVNDIFSDLMTPEVCDIDYKKDGMMKGGSRYSADPDDKSSVTLHVFGKKEKQEITEWPVYSVEAAVNTTPRSLEGLAVVDIVKREIGSSFFDIETGKVRQVTPADICILARKNDNESVKGIIRELTRAGYPVTGNKGSDVLNTPECLQIIDILSYIDNGEQDVPMASAMLSPIGKFTENELAAIRLANGGVKCSFRAACENYRAAHNDDIACKLTEFNERTEEYRRLASLFGAATLIDKILSDGAMEAVYMQGSGAKLKNVRRLAADAMTSCGELSVCDFLDKINMDGYSIKFAQSGGDDSIKIMTMHASKGLEFPIVILTDVCRRYTGGGMGDVPIPYDDEFGFVHKYYNPETHVRSDNIINVAYGEKSRAEDVKSEMNLLYVACTRAKYRLHILASELKEFSLEKAAKTIYHADLINMSRLAVETMEITIDDAAEEDAVRPVAAPDKVMSENMHRYYQKPYAYAESIDLPVKSSASAILRLQDETPVDELFPEEEEEEIQAVQGTTSAEEGTAYHRFLELCGFTEKTAPGIKAQIEGFVNDGLMDREQADLLKVENLAEILNMKVFDRVKGKKLYCEQEFLCYLPANEFLDTNADDNVMVQGAIDLLCVGDDGCDIIDYKYSKKSKAEIMAAYSKQLELYRKAVSKITGLPTEKISTTIVNIYRLYEIPLNQT